MNKIDFAVLVSVTKANPNGDPLNGNRPREDFDGYGEIASLEAFFDDNVNVNGKFASCEAYNADRGCFEPVFEASNVISGEELSKYLSHGILKLKYYVQRGADDYDEYYVPRIAAAER